MTENINTLITQLIFCMLIIFCQMYINKKMQNKYVSILFMIITLAIIITMIESNEDITIFYFYILTLIISILINITEVFKK